MKSNGQQSLAMHLSLWIVSMGAIVFVTVLSSNYFLSRLLLESYVSDIAKTTASSTVKSIETIFNSVAVNADSLAAVISTTDLNEKQIHQNINAFLKTNTAVFGMTVALEPHTLIQRLGDFSPYYYKKGNEIAYSDLADDNYQYKTWPWYSEAKKLNKSLWADPYLDDGGGNELMTTYSTPIYQRNSDTFAGIATADIRLSWLNQIISNIHIGESGFGFIIAKNDVVIAHPDKFYNLNKLDEKKLGPESWKKYLKIKTITSNIYLNTQCLHLEGNCWVAIETLGNTGWKVVIVIPEQELTSEINSLTVKISLIAIAGLIILFFVVIFITRHLTSPLAKLANATKEIGAGHLDTELPDATRNDEIGTLTKDFSTMRASLKTYIAKIQETTAKQQKLESEIEIAQDIQMSMIPGSGNASIKNANFQLFALLKPARSVGGDLYYYHHADDKLHFILGDVSDKGVPAALFMAKTVTLYTRALKDNLSPGKTLTMMNDILSENNDACMFVTALCGNINLRTGEIIMANAGHMNPIIQNVDNTYEYSIDGATALGLMDDVAYPDIKFQLTNKTALFMYTDGISESHDVDNKQYTDKKLIDFIADNHANDIEDTGNKIISSVDTFAAGTEQFDDITLLIIRYE
ncbi:MAG: SpoIIE family protein phosphatase [Gammaproteobacteria bacterium]|nr:SpoIIE family protein phosphatase [Gammaproteobacteria bacterium]